VHTKVTTQITTLIDIDTFSPEHSVHIEAEDALPNPVIYAAVEGACRAVLVNINRDKYAPLFGTDTTDEPSAEPSADGAPR